MGQHSARRSRRSTTLLRLRAVLAGGLVLGLGATATLAAWNDSEFATGTVTAGTFGIVGSADGATYAEHATLATAATFSPAMPALWPGSTGYTSFWITTTPTSVAGDIRALTLSFGTDYSATADDPLRTNILYAVRATTSTTQTCADVFAATSGVTELVAPTTLATGTPTIASPVPLAAAGASPVHLCVRMQLASTTPTTAQGQTFTVQYQFTGGIGS